MKKIQPEHLGEINCIRTVLQAYSEIQSRKGSVSDLLVFISGLVRYNEVKSLKVRARILGVIKIAFL